MAQNRKKAQISSQVFIYIMAAVIIGLIILVGYKGISAIIEFGKKIDVSTFKTQFSDEVAKTSGQYGRQKNFLFSLADKFDEICFADSRDEDNKFPDGLKSNLLLEEYPLIGSSIESDAEPNVFMLNNKKIIESFYVEKLDVEKDFLCMGSKGQMGVWLRGTGKVAVLYT